LACVGYVVIISHQSLGRRDQGITLQDEHHRTIEQATGSQGQTPDSLVPGRVEDPRDPYVNPHHYETDAWFRHLGMTDENTRSIKASIQSEREYPRDADMW
jgi:hypothetical protein